MMFGLTTQAIVQQVVEVWSAVAVAAWDAATAEPELRWMLLAFVLVSLMGGHARGRARRA